MDKLNASSASASPSSRDSSIRMDLDSASERPSSSDEIPDSTSDEHGEVESLAQPHNAWQTALSLEWDSLPPEAQAAVRGAYLDIEKREKTFGGKKTALTALFKAAQIHTERLAYEADETRIDSWVGEVGDRGLLHKVRELLKEDLAAERAAANGAFLYPSDGTFVTVSQEQGLPATYGASLVREFAAAQGGFAFMSSPMLAIMFQYSVLSAMFDTIKDTQLVFHTGIEQVLGVNAISLDQWRAEAEAAGGKMATVCVGSLDYGATVHVKVDLFVRPNGILSAIIPNNNLGICGTGGDTLWAPSSEEAADATKSAEYFAVGTFDLLDPNSKGWSLLKTVESTLANHRQAGLQIWLGLPSLVDSLSTKLAPDAALDLFAYESRISKNHGVPYFGPKSDDRVAHRRRRLHDSQALAVRLASASVSQEVRDHHERRRAAAVEEHSPAQEEDLQRWNARNKTHANAVKLRVQRRALSYEAKALKVAVKKRVEDAAAAQSEASNEEFEIKDPTYVVKPRLLNAPRNPPIARTTTIAPGSKRKYNTESSKANLNLALRKVQDSWHVPVVYNDEALRLDHTSSTPTLVFQDRLEALADNLTAEERRVGRRIIRLHLWREGSVAELLGRVIDESDGDPEDEEETAIDVSFLVQDDGSGLVTPGDVKRAIELIVGQTLPKPAVTRLGDLRRSFDQVAASSAYLVRLRKFDDPAVGRLQAKGNHKTSLVRWTDMEALLSKAFDDWAYSPTDDSLDFELRYHSEKHGKGVRQGVKTRKARQSAKVDSSEEGEEGDVEDEDEGDGKDKKNTK